MSTDSVQGTEGSTRERLLAAAAGLFAERGRDKVSIRDIAAAAGVRHGGVNYHFRSKEELYHEVLMRFGPVAGRTVLQRPVPQGLTPVEAKAAFARIIEEVVALEVQPLDPVAAGLFRGEIARPDGPNDMLFARVIQPHHAGLAALIDQMFPGVLDDRERDVAAFNVLSQCVFLRVARPVALRLFGVEEFDAELTTLVARRIIETAMHGLGSAAGEAS